MTAPAHLFLAPHYDDVALSCGGEVARWASRGASVAVVTVFAGTPPTDMPLTPYAQWTLRAWGVASVAAALRTRADEDAAACVALGAVTHSLPFVDGVFREDRYPSWDDLRAGLVPADAALPREIADTLIARGLIGPRTVVTGPLAIGRHADHRAVFAALRLLDQRGVSTRGYEDFPYAADDAEFAARMAAPDLVGAIAETVEIAPWLAAKVRAIACFRSQLPLLFPDAAMPEAVRAYGGRVAGGDGIAERFWRLPRGADRAG